MEAEGEVGGGKDGQGLDEDVGDGFVFRKVGVELISDNEYLSVDTHLKY